MTDQIPLRRALVSVYDKTGLLDLGRDLADAGVEIVSTGSTAAKKPVMNLLSGVLALMEWFSRLTIFATSVCNSHSAWTRACRLDISNDAANPLPETSATTTSTRPSAIGT